MEDYFLHLVSSETPVTIENPMKNKKGIKISILKKIVNTHLYLLDGFQLLGQNGIIHMDIKENNILMNKQNNPIIIDFGLSTNIKFLEEPTSDSAALSLDELIEKYEKADVFFTYGPDYNPWCIDISILTFMFNEIKIDENKTSWKDAIITEEMINTIIDDFYYKSERDANDNIKKLLQIFPDYKKIQKEYLMKWKDRKWKELFEELMKYKYTWDNYAVAIMYITILKDLYLWNLPLIAKYKNFLLSILVATPDKRPTIEDTKTMILSIFRIVDKKIIKKTKNILMEISKNQGTNIQKNIKLTKLINNREEEKIQNKLVNAAL